LRRHVRQTRRIVGAESNDQVRHPSASCAIQPPAALHVSKGECNGHDGSIPLRYTMETYRTSFVRSYYGNIAMSHVGLYRYHSYVPYKKSTKREGKRRRDYLSCQRICTKRVQRGRRREEETNSLSVDGTVHYYNSGTRVRVQRNDVGEAICRQQM
jgi:hypothetical protein